MVLIQLPIMKGGRRPNLKIIIIICTCALTIISISLRHGILILRNEQNPRDVRLESKSYTANDACTLGVYYDHNNVCTKKSIRLILEKVVKDEFIEFMHVYGHSPGVNTWGTRLAHQFALWTVIRWLKPKHIIESGVNMGLGTWIMRQAAPEAQLILLDPRWNAGAAYRDTHNDTIYFTGRKFKDFSLIGWNTLKFDIQRTLVFFDDHQSGIKRILQAEKLGFTHVMFDDNYSPSGGDCTGLNAACAIHMGRVNVSTLSYVDNFSRVKRPFHVGDLYTISRVFGSVIETYFEFPFPWKAGQMKNVWFPEYSWENVSNVYQYHILSNLSHQDKGYSSSVSKTHMLNNLQFENEAYRQICYVKIKHD